ncbi:RloF, putative [Helicobacter bizzozeronii CIII-1]|uniref:RloF, putative n=1 Tax=Helicobacter bizzozeronii (strain CIII-1) TaxID=1002804 RepID=F8KSQ0_HELBC|nr:DUF262 domain-containing protein [Helicobacter bizzozeronii]CCB79829.1 RloF, putative [Helicobacter bizzozeronii CIII-1]
MQSQYQPIEQFFKHCYTIPLYQRAYSWEKEQWDQFLADLEEVTRGGNKYYFGNVLLESLEDQRHIDIIDGQQRITTILIFIRALHNVLAERVKRGEKLQQDVSEEDFLKYLREDFLIARNIPKLQAVKYDDPYFQGMIIIDDKAMRSDPSTPSQERISGAKTFFLNHLNKCATPHVLNLLNKVKNAIVWRTEFKSKKDSVLMFELQNNRGKTLTHMERLKSYLAYQIYTYSPDQASAEEKLKQIASIFEDIYRMLNDIKVWGEDEILRFFNISYFKQGYGYNENDDNANYKHELHNPPDNPNPTQKDKLAWIENYAKELRNAFADFREFCRLESPYRDSLLELDANPVYPFIFKAYRIFRNAPEKQTLLEQVFKTLEVIAFRHKLISTRADLRTRLQGVLQNFTDADFLTQSIKNICENEYYWTDEDVKNALAPEQYEDRWRKNAIIILARYENHLRGQHARTKGYVTDLDKPQIEHIAPQKENNEKLKGGYCAYDDDFYQQHYLNCIGNLLLIDGTHNVSIGNRAFSEKLESYKNSPLSQQREIKNFAQDRWDKQAIKSRHVKIVEFVLATWSL